MRVTRPTTWSKRRRRSGSSLAELSKSCLALESQFEPNIELIGSLLLVRNFCTSFRNASPLSISAHEGSLSYGRIIVVLWAVFGLSWRTAASNSSTGGSSVLREEVNCWRVVLRARSTRYALWVPNQSGGQS